MKIDVRLLKDGQSIPFSYMPDLPHYDDFGRVSFPYPLEADGSVQKRGGVLVLDAAWQVWAEFRCDRCDAPFSKKLFGTVSYVLSEGNDHDGTAPLNGGICDINEILIPEVILSVESKNLCSDDCPGNPNWRCIHHGGSEE